VKTIYTYVGATGRDWTFAARDASGNVYDLTGMTVTISAVESDGTTYRLQDQACTVTNAEQGEFMYAPTAADLATADTLTAQVKITNASSEVDYLEQFQVVVQDVV